MQKYFFNLTFKNFSGIKLRKYEQVWTILKQSLQIIRL